MSMNKHNTLQDILKRLKLKHRIIHGTLYAVIEEPHDYLDYPQVRPATNQEIKEIKERVESDRKIKEILKNYPKKDSEKHHN